MERNQVAQCGTNSGYQRHIKHREVTCQPCRDAHYEVCMENQVKKTTRG